MRVNITANTCTTDNNVYLNAGEYNINKFYFTFSEEYLDNYVKKALFIDKDGTPIEMVIANNECDIPYDILKNPGTYTFGVYAYEMNGTELALRYSPEPTHFYVNKGSYIEDGTSPTEPTPDEFAQYYQAMQDLIANAKPELIDYIEDNLPTIHVGETSTLTPGTSATVTNVGTERNPIFDFGIPQGVPGTTDYNELSNKPDLTVFALVTESANKIALEIDPAEFKIKAKIFDKNNRLISESNVIDLPLESVVVSGKYDAANKKIILTLENGNTIEIPVEDLIDGLATKTELEEGLATKDANIIESISKNGAPLPVNANKNVNITVPTKTSEVINDIGFITNDTNGLSHYYNKTAADTRFSLVTETGSNFTLSIDPTTFVMTATLKDKNGRALSVQTVDLPLESVVVGGQYDSETQEVVLTLENGSVVRFSVADLVSGLQSEITDSNKLSSDLVDDTNSVNKFITTEEKTQIITNENDISDIKDEQEIQNEHLDELDMIYNAFPTVSAENETIQLDNTAKVKFREIDLKGNTSQVVIPEEQGTSVSNTSIYVSDVNTDKENTIEMSGNTYQETTSGINVYNVNGTQGNVSPEITIDSNFYITDTYNNSSGTSFAYQNFMINRNDLLKTSTNYLIVCEIKSVSGSGRLYPFTKHNNSCIETTNTFYPFSTLSAGDKILIPVTTKSSFTSDTKFDLRTLVAYNVGESGSITFRLSLLTDTTITSDTFVYQPFTYGASPNPDYPQNIEVVTGTQNINIANGDNTQSTTYPVNLGNIELCKISTYQDRIYKRNDKWYLEKKVGKITLNGTEEWGTVQAYGRNWPVVEAPNILVSTSATDLPYLYCNYYNAYKLGDIVSSNPIDYGIGKRSNHSELLVRNKDADTVASLKTWLNTHNTIVYYALATPTTTEITDNTLVSQLNALYNSTLYSTTNINTETSNLLPYIDLQYNVVTPSPSPTRPSAVNVVKGNNTITISNSDNTESQVFPINIGDMELCKIGTYQDYIYESNGNWFKKGNIGKVVLNGSENWIYTSGLGNIYSTVQQNFDYGSNNNYYANYFLYSSNDNKITLGTSGSSKTMYMKLLNSNTDVTSSDTTSTIVEKIKSWLSTHNTIVYYVLATPTETQITDTTLITQLNNIKKAYSYDAQTNISQTNTDKPFIIYAEAIDNNDDLLTDYVKNTDYATATKGGVIKVGGAYSTSVAGGYLSADVKTYSQYEISSNYSFIGKGTLENVLAERIGDIETILTTLDIGGGVN